MRAVRRGAGGGRGAGDVHPAQGVALRPIGPGPCAQVDLPRGVPCGMPPLTGVGERGGRCNVVAPGVARVHFPHQVSPQDGWLAVEGHANGSTLACPISVVQVKLLYVLSDTIVEHQDPLDAGCTRFPTKLQTRGFECVFGSLLNCTDADHHC